VADAPDRPPRPDGQEADEAADELVTGPPGVADASSRPPADAPVSDDLDAAAEAVATDIEMLAAERDEYRDAYMRAQADFENYRKQVQKRLDENVTTKLGSFVERLLPVIDACDAAAGQGESEAVEPILVALYGALEKEGLERLDIKGETFDPEVAEAVQVLPGEGGEQVVAEVMRTGYRWKGRLLRPALVKVTD
jgi:molecular chaperone GrpE